MKIAWHRLLVAVAVIGLVPVFFASKALFQVQMQGADSHRRILRTHASSEPLDIVQISVNRSSIEIGESFESSQDWLKDLRISFRNRSPRTLVSAVIYLKFPETVKSGSVMEYGITFGPPKGEMTETSRLVKQGEEFTITLTEDQLERLKKFLERRHRLDSLSKVELVTGFLYFSDGTGWSGGYMKKDPTRPNVWIDEPSTDEVRR